MSKELTPPFVWVTSTKDGSRHLKVTEMKTRHLYYTFLMIWNHSAPKHMRSQRYIRHVFGARYTPEYMFEGFKAMYIELRERDDLTEEMIRTLRWIEGQFAVEVKELKGEDYGLVENNASWERT